MTRGPQRLAWLGLLLLVLLALSSSSSSNSSSSSSSYGLVTFADAQGFRGAPQLAEAGAPPRRLQAGISFDEQDRAQKGFIVIWMSITLVFVVILGIWVTLKIADVTDPLLHTKFFAAR
ncbi:hypothetical protein, conserved [Eimeria tenella]|uniref:Uncharacterized protein n=1 Tax=Eimeria tenella TaxID=5802 RepID=U6L3Q3_EIMTE|nr:hypothetical protein, conserved [Eimeria tenella]CDJ43244.1 hypothetical protein, conserved [Eimeria tenella]|eukprot:XP_013233994.1 hypothetical protein, conserved [Eimeria tenella]